MKSLGDDSTSLVVHLPFNLYYCTRLRLETKCRTEHIQYESFFLSKLKLQEEKFLGSCLLGNDVNLQKECLIRLPTFACACDDISCYLRITLCITCCSPSTSALHLECLLIYGARLVYYKWNTSVQTDTQYESFFPFKKLRRGKVLGTCLPGMQAAKECLICLRTVDGETGGLSKIILVFLRNNYPGYRLRLLSCKVRSWARPSKETN